jgi:hypothetical protein
MVIHDRSCLWVAALTLFGGACDVAELDAEEVHERAVVGNAVVLNSAAINGLTLNGWTLNGWTLNGWTLNGWTLNGWTLNGVTLSGSSFTGTQTIDGQQVVRSGVDLVGSELQLAHSNGKQYVLRFDDIDVSSSVATGDVLVYQVSVFDPVTGGWSSLCKDGQGQPTGAIALANTWNAGTGARIDAPGSVTLACRGGVLAKCVEMGYRPWATATRCVGSTCTQVSLADYHQACTRMARADYCGDGTPHTFNGTPIDVFDRLKTPVQVEGTPQFANWDIEAEWGPNGAVCVGDDLRLKMFDDLGIDYEYPACLDAIDDISDCGTFKPSRNARVASKYCYKWTDDMSQCEG